MLKQNELSDFEKNLFLKHHIKELINIIRNKNFKIGELTSEKDEYRYIINKDNQLKNSIKTKRQNRNLKEIKKNLKFEIKKNKHENIQLILELNSLKERIFECKNFLIQKTDASGIVTEETQKIFDFLLYIEDGKIKPFK